LYSNSEVNLTRVLMNQIEQLTRNDNRALQLFFCALVYVVSSKTNSENSDVILINNKSDAISENDVLIAKCDFSEENSFKEVLQQISRKISVSNSSVYGSYTAVCISDSDDQEKFNEYIEKNQIRMGLFYNTAEKRINVYTDLMCDMFDTNTVKNVFKNAISCILSNINSCLYDISLISDEETKELEKEINTKTELNYTVFNKALEEALEKGGSKIALKCNIDLDDVYAFLEDSKNAAADYKIKKCVLTRTSRFRIKKYDVEKGILFVLQTPDNDIFYLNHNAELFINSFDGNKNVQVLFDSVNSKNYDFYMSSKNKEITFHGDISDFDNLKKLIQLLYKFGIITLTAYSNDMSYTVQKLVPDEDEFIGADDVCLPYYKIQGTEVIIAGEKLQIYEASYLSANNISVLSFTYRELTDLINQINQDQFSSLKYSVFCIDKYEDIAVSLKLINELREKNNNVQSVVIGKLAGIFYKELSESDDIDFVINNNNYESLYSVCTSDNEYRYNYEHKSTSETNPDHLLADLSEIVYSSLPFDSSIEIKLSNGAEAATIINNVKAVSTLFGYISFEFDDNCTLEFFTRIFNALDVHDCLCKIHCTSLPDKKIIEYLTAQFRFIEWDIVLYSLSERHRKELQERFNITVQPSDDEIFRFLDACEKIANNEVGISFIIGLPCYNYKDIEETDNILNIFYNKYHSIRKLNAEKAVSKPEYLDVFSYDEIGMYTYASSYEEFLYFSELNLYNVEADETDVEKPYLMFADEEFNDNLIKNYLNVNKKTANIVGSIRRQIVFNSYSYNDIRIESNKLACYLKDKNVKKGDNVILLCSNPFYQIISIFASIKLGAVYVPLDIANPYERVCSILKQTSSECIISDSVLKNDYDVNNIINLSLSEYEMYPSESIITEIDPSDSIYIIFTSGTTGTPKGVELSNISLCNFIQWRIKKYGFTSEDVTMQTLQYSFDGYYTNLYSSIMSNGQLVVFDCKYYREYTEFPAVISNLNITNMSTVPPIAKAVYTYGNKSNLRSLRFIVLAGQKSDDSLLRTIKNYTPDVRIINEYGPTECCIAVFSNNDLDETNISTIGEPVWNTGAVILNHNNELMPIGVIGEICIYGIQLAKKYIGLKEETENKFIIQKSLNERVYKTGDLGYSTPDGKFHIMGRIDNQLKVNGFRIEPFEIERIITSIEEVDDCAVLSAVTNDGVEQIVAYYSSEKGMLKEKIYDKIISSLPKYMIPAKIIRVRCILRNSNGKIVPGNFEVISDNQEETAKKVFRSPRNEIEKEIISVIEEVLEVSGIGIDDNFFELGGNSFNALSIVSKTNRLFNTEELFSNPTVRMLYDNIISVNYHDDSILKQMNVSANSEYAMICIPYGGGTANVYYDLSKEVISISDKIDIYSVRLPGHEITDDENYMSIKDIANKILEYVIERNLYKKKLVVYGHCSNGSALTIELTRLLQENNMKPVLSFVGAALPANNSKIALKLIDMSSKLASDEAIFTRLKKMGFSAGTDESFMDRIVRAFRFDGESATEYYINMEKDVKLDVPIINIVSDDDPATKGYSKKYIQWNKYTDMLSLIVVNGGGHYFVNSRTAETAEKLVKAILMY